MPNLNFFAGSVLFGFLMEVLQFFGRSSLNMILPGVVVTSLRLVLFFTVNIFVRYINLNACLQINNLMEVCQHSFVNAAEAHAFAFGSFFHHGDVVRARTISWVGTATGLPSFGARILLTESIKILASACASAESGRCTAIWSPSKSALNAVHTKGCSLIARPSVRIARMPEYRVCAASVHG